MQTVDTSGIMGAMPEEIALLLASLEAIESLERAGFTLYRGRLDGKAVLLAQCGIGKVNAAALTQTMLLEGVARLIFTGVAGALEPSLEVGDLVVSSDALQHDVDVSALGYGLGEVPGEPLSWSADPQLRELALEAAEQLPDVQTVSGRVLSGDQFVASAEKGRSLRETFGGVCAEMEGAAVAQICAKANIPFVIIRSISDTADHRANIDFRAFTPLAARRAKQVVRTMLASL